MGLMDGGEVVHTTTTAEGAKRSTDNVVGIGHWRAVPGHAMPCHEWTAAEGVRGGCWRLHSLPLTHVPAKSSMFVHFSTFTGLGPFQTYTALHTNRSLYLYIWGGWSVVGRYLLVLRQIGLPSLGPRSRHRQHCPLSLPPPFPSPTNPPSTCPHHKQHHTIHPSN